MSFGLQIYDQSGNVVIDTTKLAYQVYSTVIYPPSVTVFETQVTHYSVPACTFIIVVGWSSSTPVPVVLINPTTLEVTVEAGATLIGPAKVICYKVGA